MEKLDKKYIDQLDAIQQEMMQLDAYSQFLDTEEEEHYNELQDIMGPKISALYHQVSTEKPLQLLEFERSLLKDELEGMFLPRMLGYTVMRGVINKDTYKYILSQEHFQEVLVNICNSPNFEFLRSRIGQTVQLGFGLSSDIWVTNLINVIPNKKVKTYLKTQKDSKYRLLENRKYLYTKYLRQFRNDNYFTTVFPTTMPELSVYFPELRNFLIQRTRLGVRDASLTSKLVEFLADKSYFGSPEQFALLALTVNFVTLDDAQKKIIGKLFNDLRVELDNFDEQYLKYLIEFYDINLPLNEDSDAQVLSLLEKKGDKDQLYKFYKLTETIHSKGFTHPEVIEAVKLFYINHDGTSLVNKAVRNIILGYAGKFANNLDVESYQDYFDLMDYFKQYINIFDNQKFNQRIKDYSMIYIKKLLKRYTDKRGKDYQSIKRFVRATFLELEFMDAKELTLMFKTKRVRKKVKEA
ncbi:MAG TPA: hypothetical protein ENK85_04920 [Saprospiraceae bacterium]|nr:hypothetical protein [Saprospiraceae bacterium]